MTKTRRLKFSKRPARWKRILPAIALGVMLASVALLFFGNSWGLTPLALFRQSLPEKDRIAVDFPDRYLIETPNYFEQQGTNQCGGFSSAFVLRHFGQEAAGEDLYDRSPRAMCCRRRFWTISTARIIKSRCINPTWRD